MANAIGCGAAKFPFKYLGVPVGGNMGRCSNWDPVIQKFSSRLSTWKAQLLSNGGQLTLLTYVLGSLPLYFMSLYMASVSICNKLESMRNQFFLGDWNHVLRRPVRGGIESVQFLKLNHLINDVMLSDQNDSWSWSIDISKGFSVASVRSLIDSCTLEDRIVLNLQKISKKPGNINTGMESEEKPDQKAVLSE
nr:RNA-directed DNA polymerase, eukaryota [Tanacetum cinerariifolium]